MRRNIIPLSLTQYSSVFFVSTVLDAAREVKAIAVIDSKLGIFLVNDQCIFAVKSENVED